MAYSMINMLKVCDYRQPTTVLDSGKNKCQHVEGTCILSKGKKCPYGDIEAANDSEEPRFLLDMDSVCYGCQYYTGEEICNTPQPCISGSMNGYRMDGQYAIYGQ